jgi:P pilus assembly chaperone PapD
MKHLSVYCSGLFCFLIFTLLLGSEMLLAQVTVAPVMLFIDSKSGIGNLYITNNSATPQEVSISFVYGYPDADSVGNPKINYSDTISAGIYSLTPMIRAFPRSFILNGQQAQTIRLQVRTNGSVKDASFFSRVKVTSSQKTPDVEKKTTTGVATQINFKFDQVFPVFYRKGNVSTGLVVHDVDTKFEDKKLIVIADVERKGNTPYIGSVKAELFSDSNEKVALMEATASIYFRLKEKIELDMSKKTKGKYRLLLTYETKRSDIAVEDILQAPTVTKEVAVNLQ